MRRLAALWIILAALLLGASPGEAASNCQVLTVAANSTVPATPYVLANTSAPTAVWLKIVTTGSGTPSVAVNAYGPADVAGANRASFLYGTLNAGTTYAALATNIEAVDATVTGCTGTCSLRIAICGTRNATR